MKKIIIVFAVALFAISIISAPVMAGSGCASLKGSKCALTGKTCTAVKTAEAETEKPAGIANATLSIDGLKDTEKTEKMSKMLGVSVSESFHKEVFDFVNERNWNMGAFLRQAIQESMTKVVKNEKRKS